MAVNSSSETLKKHFLHFEGDWRGNIETKPTTQNANKKNIQRSAITGTAGKVWYMFPDYMVYINGVDFSDLIETINISHNNIGQPSTASFSLVNPELILNYTEKNISDRIWNEYRLTKEGSGKFRGHIAARDNKVLEIGEMLKKAMFDNKSSYGGTDKMWPLKAGDCCIDTNDPVRIFLKDPYIGNVETDGQKNWLYAFTGFVDSVTDTEDTEMNATVSVIVSDVRKLMKTSRMATNTGIDIPLIADRVDALQKDIGDPGSYTTKLQGFTLPQIIVAMINGTQFMQNPGKNIFITDGATDPSKQTQQGVEIGEVGEFQVYSHAFTPDGDLSDWQQKFDMRLSKKAATDIGIATCWGGDYWPGSKYKQRIMILLPKGKGGDIIGTEVRNEFAIYSEFQNRLEFLNEKVQQADMEFYCTPAGDLVFEIKLYSTDPWNYGDKWGEKDWHKQSKWGVFQESDCIDNYSITDSDADVVTHVRVTGANVNIPEINNIEISLKGMAPYAGSYGTGKPIQGKVELQKISPEERGMLRRFGLRYMQKHLPHIGDVRKTQLYAEAMYELQKSNMKTANVTILPSFELGINRPFMIGARAKQFTITNITHSISWNGSIDTSLTLSNGRSYEGNGKFVPWKHPFLYSEGF